MARLPRNVRKIDTPAGVRYEARVNAWRGDGSRVQLRKRCRTPAAALEWFSATAAALSDGSYTPRSGLTVRQACEDWLESMELRVKPTTHAAYSAALAPVIERYGDLAVQRVTKAHIETLVRELVTGTPLRKPWARTSVNPMLARLRTVFGDLQAEGILSRNVVALVKPLRKPAGELELKIDDSLTSDEVDTLMAAHDGHRREVFLVLALLGLRRGEISGLRWSAVELDTDAPTLTVRETRVSTAAGIVQQNTAKTASSARVLPLPATAVTALKRARLEHRAARLRAGNLWRGDADGHVVALDLGAPPSPRTLDDWWHRALKHAGLQPRRLHAARHTAASLLNARGVSVPAIAAWLGHSDGGVLALRVYTRSRGEALVEAARLLG